MSDTTTVNVSTIQKKVTVNVVTGGLTINGGGGSGDGLTEVIGEEHTGLTTTSLTLDHAAAAGKLKQFKNGSRLIASEFSYVGVAVTLTTLPETTDVFSSDYKY